jgi:hypothetical protein
MHNKTPRRVGTKERKASKARDKCKHDRRKASRAEADKTGAQGLSEIYIARSRIQRPKVKPETFKV